MTCSQDKWVEISCDDGKCIYTADGVACKSKEGCEDGTNSCANNGLVKHCQDGIWSYTSCDMGMSCNDGVCSKDTQEELDYLVSRRCTKDNKGIIEAYTDKEITTTCLKEVGFASSCKQFSSEQAGCVLPSACDATFSSEGTCFGDKLAFCEDERIIPAPAVIDCASLGKTCAKLNGKSYCLDKCAQEDELSCVKKDGIERPSRCIKSDQKLVNETRIVLCKDDKTSVQCAKGAVVETACLPSERCIPELGTCVGFCKKSEVGQAKCSSAGVMTQCQKYDDDYRYINVGGRHCNGDILQICVKDGDDYKVKETNCRTYEPSAGGDIIEGRCVIDYQYPGGDFCIPVIKGPECGKITDAGICDDGELYVCEEADNALWKRNCKRDIDGSTACTSFAGYSDCRRPCDIKGKASCYKAGSEENNIRLCAPDDKTQVLSEVEGVGICLDGLLHSCTSAGVPVTSDCLARGGTCAVMDCNFAACPIEAEPKCAGPKGNLVLGCETYDNGLVIGYTLNQTYCKSKQECYSCKNGKMTRI